MTFYVNDPHRPDHPGMAGCLRDLSRRPSAMPAELRDHPRYQRTCSACRPMCTRKYQLQPADFFQRDGAWSVAQAPASIHGATSRRRNRRPNTAPADEQQGRPSSGPESTAGRFIPYYTMFRNTRWWRQPGRVRAAPPVRSVLSRGPADRAAGHMTASSDPDVVWTPPAYVVQNDPLPDGPRAVSNLIDSEPSTPNRSRCRPAVATRSSTATCSSCPSATA